MKILGFKNYGSIPHLRCSKLGSGDHFIENGQELILTKKARDKHDNILVFENCSKGVQSRYFECSTFDGLNGGKDRIHPTEKPVKLYDWIYLNFAKRGDLILDTHLGSQASRIAAHKSGLSFVGFETDEVYYKKGEARFKRFIAQLRLF